MRQLADATANVTLTRSYEPFGNPLTSVGSGGSIFQYTGEQRDLSNLIFLRARYLSTATGRFITADTWAGDANRPLSLNKWNYVEGNPINRVDPSGHKSIPGGEGLLDGQITDVGSSPTAQTCLGGYTLATVIDFYGRVTVNLVRCETQKPIPGDLFNSNCSGQIMMREVLKAYNEGWSIRE